MTRSGRYVLAVCFLALLICAVAGVFVGARRIPAAETLAALWAFDPNDSVHLLVTQLRVPRVLLGLVIGAGLGCAGVVMQGLTRNPLADPGLLGVNAGAALTVVLTIAIGGLTDIRLLMGFALLGAALAGAVVAALGGVLAARGDPVRLILGGAALSAVLLSLTQIVTVNSEDPIFDQFRFWVVGALAGRSYDVLWPCMVLTLIGIAVAFTLAPALDVLELGSQLGVVLGLRLRLVWLAGAAAVILLGGAATAAAGPVSFVGLAAAHFARRLVGPAHALRLPTAVLMGALMVTGCDLLGRLVAWPGEIPLGVMGALIGGPVLVLIAVQQTRISV